MLFLVVSVERFPEEVSIRIDRQNKLLSQIQISLIQCSEGLNRARRQREHPPSLDAPSPPPSISLSLLDQMSWDISLLLPLDWNLHHQLSWAPACRWQVSLKSFMSQFLCLNINF